MKFYVLEYYTHPAPEVVDVTYKHVKCDKCGTRPVARIGGTSVRFTKKAELVDFSRTAQGLIVHQSVVGHLVEARISGWRSGCLKTEIAPTLSIPDIIYYELVITGHTRGFAEHTGLKIERECKECGLRKFARPQEGITIPVECWDGSDIFVIDELPGIYIVTDAFCQVIEKYQHTGVEFVLTNEWRDPLGWIGSRR